MTDPFARAIDVAFERLGQEATWHPAGGGDVPVRVIPRAPDRLVDYAESRIAVATTVLDVRVSELAQPARGDTVTLGSERLTVQGAPTRDRRRLVWRVEARP